MCNSVRYIKAFDTVNFGILLYKLDYHGICGPCYKLLNCYLNNRKQYVCSSGYKSSLVDVECSVPQGSVLGPLLFILYVNDMRNALQTIPRLFADDICLFLTAKNIVDLEIIGNSELSSLKNWMDTNKLTVNPTKSNLIVVNPKLRAPQIQFSLLYDDTCIGNDKSLKYLGVELDQELNFSPHLTKIENKLSQNIGKMTKLKHYVPNSALLMLYYSIVYPHILYGIFLWGSTYTSHHKKLQLLQNIAVRAICSLNWHEHVTPCFDRLSILKVRDVSKMEMAKFVHKSVNHSLPKYFQTYFHKVSLPKYFQTYFHKVSLV